MKPAVLLALPALALAAAAPKAIEERTLPGIPLDPTCVLSITGITNCAPSLDPNNPPTQLILSDLVGLLTCPILIIFEVLGCILPP
ncbi:hypothetical protein N0V84_000860 [Fusarium piperis]|uniref:Hydrophobin n=1 Tax=Fusarium piperis TaxID=1435070 RepID=A0A9W9BT45_9HYPO|nr:hypothetical protein N0V84_000860 [Fusarium piperis]